MIKIGIKQKEIAQTYSCNPSTISHIKRNKLWRHINV